ncbi:MAG: hypothetical protein UV58_C0014G0002 [Candidatus Wolfebacteria bacterium GW2011_GWC1_43_10]|uniref:DUF4190 domain-containing protein n=1 Tax=Candidatus Wolfebacteria bacterium GW2011_GWC1_43_10 TaxID=1619011 RepID=A0A0G1EFZ9_9BACT|nr:MAG: hypothetical protein UV58_C0014G0002 [Candidatus Wolfebacteria bacterium GW2011_GWC1_43_10]
MDKVKIPSTGKPCTKCGERNGNPLHNGICNVCYSNSLSKEETNKKIKNIFNRAQNKTHNEQEVGTKTKKNPFAIWGFIVGIASVFLGMGLPPIVATVLSAVGINKTKKPGTGRWMAVTGLILGILYFIVYLYNYGYI